MVDYTEDPSRDTALAAELAVAKLQRAHDHVLRRLDGEGEVPEFPVHQHDAASRPETCAIEALEMLAGAQLADRAETLAHGLEAVNSLARDRDQALTAARHAQHRLDMLDLSAQSHADQVDES